MAVIFAANICKTFIIQLLALQMFTQILYQEEKGRKSGNQENTEREGEREKTREKKKKGAHTHNITSFSLITRTTRVLLIVDIRRGE